MSLPTSALAPSAAVIVDLLVGRTDLNGRLGTVCMEEREDGRIGVELAHSKERVWIKARNMIPLDTPAAMRDAVENVGLEIDELEASVSKIVDAGNANEESRARWRSAFLLLEVRVCAIFLLPDAPYTYRMEKLGYESRQALKHQRALQRANKLGLTPLGRLAMGGWLDHYRHGPREDAMDETKALHLLTQHMDQSGRTHHEAALDTLHFLCAGNEFDPTGQALPGCAEGCQTFCYDTFQGGDGYDQLFMKKSDPSLQPIRWLVSEYSRVTGQSLPKLAKEAICEATAGLLYGKEITGEANPDIKRDYSTIGTWVKKREIFYGHKPLETQAQRWQRLSAAHEDWDVE